MAETTKSLEEMIKELPPELYREVADFVQFLVEKRVPKATGEARFEWQGALSNLRDQYTSVELQHHIRDTWDEDVSS
jgi:Protein of unknown function (DUF2281)